ncbi:MAG: B12-binding domain-containing radical SAM protein [Deltaproteobacteria bacterium]|nr:B12-binding domain-containing radical SAM protein [Deltaproteobacteria bacterium]
MKLLLIAPAGLEVQGVKGKHVHHLNLAVIAALATPYFDEIKIIEEEFERLDPDESADFVGITMMSCQAPRGYWLADQFRKKGVRTICGGSHASFMVEECGKHFDSVVVNEVEMVWEAIMADFHSDRLKPVYQTSQLIDLKDLPMPRKDLFFNAGTTLNAQVIQSGRGCPLGCNFCTVTLMYGKTFRTRPVEHVVEEIKRYPSKIFFFVDDNIFLSRSYAYELCEALIPLKIKWGSQGSMELICKDEKLLKLAARAGCMSLFVGIESIDQKTLDSAHKSFNMVKNYEENIRKMHRAGINVVGAFIFGFDQDTAESFDRVFDFAMKNRLAMVNTGIMTPFPGTEVYEKAKREGKIFDHDWEHYTGANLVWRHPTMSKEEIEEVYAQFRQRFYTWPSIFKRFWANRSHPLYYFGMNFTHWWRAHRNPRQALPSVAPALP